MSPPDDIDVEKAENHEQEENHEHDENDHRKYDEESFEEHTESSAKSLEQEESEKEKDDAENWEVKIVSRSSSDGPKQENGLKTTSSHRHDRDKE